MKNNTFFGKTIIEDKEAELKDITKSALVHNLVIEVDAKNEITKERDEIYSENEKLFEENEMLKKRVKFLQRQCWKVKQIKQGFTNMFERTYEENKNFQTIIDRMNEEIKELREAKDD